MGGFASGVRVRAADGRAGAVVSKQFAGAPGPAGDFYAVRFDGAEAAEWQPGGELVAEGDPAAAAWLAQKKEAADARSAQEAIDNARVVAV